MDEPQKTQTDQPTPGGPSGADPREAYEAPAVESLGGVYGQTQQTAP
jgi:hypothetical protein